MEGFVEVLPRALLEISLLLAGAVIVNLLARRAHLPFTVVLAVVGLLLVEYGVHLELAGLFAGAGFEELLVNLFLPILIFEAALGLSTREFMRNLVAIVALATVALVISAALVGASLQLALGLPFTLALLFGVLISATDPVAVVAVFRQLGVPPRLLTLVEGESMLNDGVAIVLYEILVVVALGGALSVAEGAADFVLVFAGGLAIGGVIGVVAVLLLPLLDRLSAAALSVAVAYGGFVLAEAVLGFSGVMATVAAGVVIGGTIDSRVEPSVRDLLRELWDALGFIANALLFLFIGLALDLDLLVSNLDAVALAVLAVLVARPIAVVPVVHGLQRLGAMPRLGGRSAAVIVWGGLRGGVALALALALPEELAGRELLVALTGGVVLATLVVNATTIPFLVHALGLDRRSPRERYIESVARLLAVKAADERLKSLELEDPLVDAHLRVAEADARDQLERARLTEDEERAVLTLRGLRIEQQTYQRLNDSGLLPPIAARTLLQEIDDEIEEVRFGELDVDAARRGRLPWYARWHRWLLGALPEPLGEDLDEVAYVEVSARRIAAGNAADELARFVDLPGVAPENVHRVRATFLHWQQAATRTLQRLEADESVDRLLLRRRQAQALSRMAAAQSLQDLSAHGLFSENIADRAADRVSEELDQAGR